MSEIASLHARLAAGAARLSLALDERQLDRLLAYLELLTRWNQTYNLTAVREPEAMLGRHLFDSLAVAPLLVGTRIADLGSGAGLPGIPLAIARPELAVTLVEANGKKARFLRECVRRLPLDNVTVIEARAEGADVLAPVDTVVARALASLPELTRLAAHWLEPGGTLLALKGPDHEAELHGLAPGFAVESIAQLAVPDLDGTRYVVVVKRARSGASAPGEKPAENRSRV